MTEDHRSLGEYFAAKIAEEHRRNLDRREFTYVSVHGTNEGELDHFVLWIAKPKQEVNERAKKFIHRIYGRDLDFSAYPRNYVQEARSLVAIGVHEEAQTADIERTFHEYADKWKGYQARLEAALARNRERKPPPVDYSGTYHGRIAGDLPPTWTDRFGRNQPAPEWMLAFEPGQRFVDGKPIGRLRHRAQKPDTNVIDLNEQPPPTFLDVVNEVTGIPFRVRLLREGESYGLDNQVRHDRPDALVEIYDFRHRNESQPLGQFVSRYYASTFLRRVTGGLDLQGDVDDWKLTSKNMAEARSWVSSELDNPWVPIPPPPPPKSRSLTPTELNLVDAGNRKATLYLEGAFGRLRIEVSWFRVYRAPRAQYSDAIFVEFRPRNRRKTMRRVETSRPSLVVLLGWNHPDLQQLFREEITDGWVVHATRHNSCARAWEDEFEAALKFYLETQPLTQVLLDLRGATVAERTARTRTLDTSIPIMSGDGRNLVAAELPVATPPRKHRVFVSYFHQDEAHERDEFEDLCGSFVSSASIYPGEIPSDRPEVIRHEIRKRIAACELLLVLIGKRTYTRRWVDWEIRSALDNSMEGGRRPVVGMLTSELSPLLGAIRDDLAKASELPQLTTRAKADEVAENMIRERGFTLPRRLIDNLLIGYADLVAWQESATEFEGLFTRDRPDGSRQLNSRPIMVNDLSLA